MKNNSISCDFESNHTCWKEKVFEFNTKWALLMVPVEVMMCLFMVVGFFGNILVLVIYSYRRQKTSANIFIMFLACIDLFACLVLHPYIIYKQFHNYDQTWTKTCKLFEYFIHCSLGLSGLTLLLVAIDRYLAICKPVKFLLFDKHVVKGIAIISAISVILSLPILEFYGASQYDVVEFGSNFTGFKCHYKIEYQNSHVLTAFGAFIMIAFLSEIAAMVILYKQVAVTAYRSRRAVRPLSNAHILAGIKPLDESDARSFSRRTQSSEVNRSNCPSPLFNITHMEETSRNANRLSTITPLYSSVRSASNTGNFGGIERQDRTTSPENSKHISENRTFSTRLKAAKILFFVTAVFFLSWMPFFVMRICVTLNPNYWSDWSVTRYVIETFLNHVFYLNSAANPIIYTIINKNFRMDCKIVFEKYCKLR